MCSAGSLRGVALLFILFIDDILRNIPRTVHAGIYADDLKLYAAIKDRADLQLAIDTVCRWASDWNMSFSIPKCVFMQYGITDMASQYSLNGSQISRVEIIRDLGIMMTPNLVFDKHIELIINKAKSRMNNILRCFKCNDLDFLKKSFTVYVLPLLESATEIWSPPTIGNCDDLEKVLRSFTRRIFSRAQLAPLSFTERLSFLNLETLEYRRALRDLIFLFKSVHGLVSFDKSYSFKRAPLNRQLRNSHPLRLDVSFTIKAKKRNIFSHRAIPVWNKLNFDIVNSDTLQTFKNRLKQLPKNVILQELSV